MNQALLNRINYFNIGAMLASSVIAILIPFELVLLSYAILGPAHYLTEISWLSGRQFFTLRKYDYLLIAAVVVVSLFFRLPFANLVFYTFGLCFVLIVTSNHFMRLLGFLLLVAAGYFLLTTNIVRTIFGLYVPTLIHVYCFTGAFILSGALKDRVASGYLAFAVFLLCPVLLCCLFTGYHNPITAWAINNYGYFGRINATTLRKPSLNVFTSQTSIILTRLIAFAYSYHYINWFSKTSVISWHRLGVNRALVLGLIWAASVALYFYDYRLGFKWLLILSLAHVILEFPLNHRSFIGIGRALRNLVKST